MNEIEIYIDKEKQTQLEVRFQGETVWLTQNQIAVVFGTQRPAITKHLNNIFKSGELDEQVASSILEHTTQHGALKGRTQSSKVKYYNLDAIISVGYRVNSTRATQFRQWATQRLKEYLVKGYAFNQKRLDELGKMVELIEQSSKTEKLELNEAKGLLDILGNYTKSFVLLNQFDSNSVKTGRLSENITYEIQYDEAKQAIREIKKSTHQTKRSHPSFRQLERRQLQKLIT